MFYIHNGYFPDEVDHINGDKSDNINGIYFLGEKTLIKLFPEVLEKTVSFNDILVRAETLLKEDKENKDVSQEATRPTKKIAMTRVIINVANMLPT